MVKFKDFLTYLALAIIVLPILFFTNIFSVKALDYKPDLSTLPYNSNARSIVVYYNGNNDTFRALYSTSYFNVGAPISSSLINGNQFIDYRTNFYGISQIFPLNYVSPNSSYRWDIGYDYDSNTNTWNQICSGSSCGYGYSYVSSSYVYAYFVIQSSSSVDSSIVYNRDLNQVLFKPNWNLEYYVSVTDYFTGYTSYIGQPTLVTGSHLSYTSDELTSTIQDIGKRYINSYVYAFDDTSIDFSLLGARFNYSLSSDSYQELGFILTWSRFTDTPPVVYVNTSVNSYQCNVTSVLDDNDNLTYQWYVNCPSVEFSSNSEDSDFNISVQGSQEIQSIQGPAPFYDTNFLKYDNKGYVGISAILRKTTGVEPTPVPPGPATNDDINNSINNLTDNIMDTSSPDVSSLSNSAGWLPPGPVDSIINLPITIFQSLLNVLNNSSCSPVQIPIPFINYTYSLPCISTIISNMGLISWWEGIGTIASAFILYKYMISLYAWVDKTLTFRQNNWNDWGGI